MATEFKDIESRLWKVADTLRANSGLRFHEAQTRLASQYLGEPFTRDDFQAEGVLYVRESARYHTLLHLPESADIGQAVNDAMRAIEEDNDDLRDTLPKDYRRF